MNKKSINIGFKILSLLAFGLIFMPFNKAAAMVYPTYVLGGYSNDGQTYTLGHFVWSDDPNASNGGATSDNGLDRTNNNPTPRISSINPKSGSVDMTTNTITISGSGFTPTSVARINTSVRQVTFIDPSHLLLPINSNDLYAYQNNGGFFVTVYNEAPGGGYSNAAYFTVKAVNGSSKNNNSDGLAANAFFGTNSFLPSGLVSWILLGIMILVIIILVRKIFGADKKYHETPLKHA
ncbi:MAG: IPT/TIG domain-containing protein [Candidatus Paceibacterota bacterium]|jgi:hypothetical protein